MASQHTATDFRVKATPNICHGYVSHYFIKPFSTKVKSTTMRMIKLKEPYSPKLRIKSCDATTAFFLNDIANKALEADFKTPSGQVSSSKYMKDFYASPMKYVPQAAFTECDIKFYNQSVVFDERAELLAEKEWPSTSEFRASLILQILGIMFNPVKEQHELILRVGQLRIHNTHIDVVCLLDPDSENDADNEDESQNWAEKSTLTNNWVDTISYSHDDNAPSQTMEGLQYPTQPQDLDLFGEAPKIQIKRKALDAAKRSLDAARQRKFAKMLPMV